MKNRSLVASSPRPIKEMVINRIVPLKHIGLHGGGPTSRLLLFLLKVAALELVRRVSEVKCPLAWKILQGLQVIGYLPQRWLHWLSPMRKVARFMQIISRPLLFLSVTTSVSEILENSKDGPADEEDQEHHPEASAPESTSYFRKSEESTESLSSENPLQKLHHDLEKQGIILPPRINDDELSRFLVAANGNFECLAKLLRKTMNWRETFTILSLDQLQPWSHLVFWHGYDIHLRPCLVIRLGLACTVLSPTQRTHFTQAIISQVEHGVLFLVNGEDCRITVLMDCEGLSPFKIPMNVLRSCSSVLQDNYPNRLAALLVARLPPVVRFLTQTLVQMMRPTTREKLRVMQNDKALAELVQVAPAFLGGGCGCQKCNGLGRQHRGLREEGGQLGGGQMVVAEERAGGTAGLDQATRTAMVGMLMVWIFLAYLVGMKDQDGGLSTMFS
ncbi:SEC14 cytosolic factor family protein / phosphoglyceride transfer family protein [Wolffia australiana]